MKKLLFLGCMFISGALCAGQYVGINAGTNNMVVTNGHNPGGKIGFKAGFTYGRTFDSGFRAELACSYAENNNTTKYEIEADDSVLYKRYHHAHSWTYMANCLYDVKQLTFQTVFPYLGVGVGYAQNTVRLKFKGDNFDHESKEKDNRFAYQAIAGVRYAINDDYLAGLEYNYHCGKSHAKDHSVGLHLIRNF